MSVFLYCAFVIALAGIILLRFKMRSYRRIPRFLMFHSVASEVVNPAVPNNTVRPTELENLIVKLKQRGFTFQFVKEAIEKPVSKAVVLTFDDGRIDNYENLFPILKRQNVKASLFVTNRGENNAAFIPPGRILEMHRSGLVEFGAHTVEHSILTEVSIDECRRTLAENKKWLENIIGEEVVSFAYPCGSFNAEVIACVKAAGFKYALTMQKKMRPVGTDLLQIHRQIIPRDLKTHQAYFLATLGKYKL